MKFIEINTKLQEESRLIPRPENLTEEAKQQENATHQELPMIDELSEISKEIKHQLEEIQTILGLEDTVLKIKVEILPDDKYLVHIKTTASPCEKTFLITNEGKLRRFDRAYATINNLKKLNDNIENLFLRPNEK